MREGIENSTQQATNVTAAGRVTTLRTWEQRKREGESKAIGTMRTARSAVSGHETFDRQSKGKAQALDSDASSRSGSLGSQKGGNNNDWRNPSAANSWADLTSRLTEIKGGEPNSLSFSMLRKTNQTKIVSMRRSESIEQLRSKVRECVAPRSWLRCTSVLVVLHSGMVASRSV